MKGRGQKEEEERGPERGKDDRFIKSSSKEERETGRMRRRGN